MTAFPIAYLTLPFNQIMSSLADPFKRSSTVSRPPVRDWIDRAESVFSPMQPRLPLSKKRMSFRRAIKNRRIRQTVLRF